MPAPTPQRLSRRRIHRRRPTQCADHDGPGWRSPYVSCETGRPRDSLPSLGSVGTGGSRARLVRAGTPTQVAWCLVPGAALTVNGLPRDHEAVQRFVVIAIYRQSGLSLGRLIDAGGRRSFPTHRPAVVPPREAERVPTPRAVNLWEDPLDRGHPLGSASNRVDLDQPAPDHGSSWLGSAPGSPATAAGRSWDRGGRRCAPGPGSRRTRR